MILGKNVVCVHCSGLFGDRPLSQYDSFTHSFELSMIAFIQKIFLERLFVSDTGEASACYVHCSGLLGDRVLSQYNSFT